MLAGMAFAPQIGTAAYNDTTGNSSTDRTTSTDKTMGKIDVNSASKSELTGLPGVTDSDADKIIGNRPYKDTEDLVDKKVLTKSQYDTIKDQITCMNKK